MAADDSRSDAELVDAINRGEVHAFEVLYYRHRDWVVRLAMRFAGHAEDALDVLQETFAYVSRKFPGFVLTAGFRTFLYPVVKHLAIAAQRKRRRFVGADESLEDWPAPEAPAGEEGEVAAVVAGLPAIHREVLLMRFVDGLTMEEIALALGVPVGTVKSRLHHGLEKLREDPRTRAYWG